MKNFITNCAFFFTLAIFTILVQAEDDPRYPAYHFEPEVIFRSPALIKNLEDSQQQSQTDTKYPGAYFTPYVIYQDLEMINQEIGEKMKTPTTQRNTPEPTHDKQYSSEAPNTSTVVVHPEPNSFPFTALGLLVILILIVFWIIHQASKTRIRF